MVILVTGPSAVGTVSSCTCMHVDKTADEVEWEKDVNSCDTKEIVLTSASSLSFHEIETLKP